MDISCIVLAGGKSLRLGYNKAVEFIGSRTLLERVISSISFLNSEVIVVTAGELSLTQLIGYPELRMATDIYPGRGPLGGIFTGLATSDSFYNLVVPCDTPFLNQALLHYMIQLSADFDLVVPRLGNEVEPLHAVYSKACLTPAEGMIKQGNLSVYKLFSLVKVRYVEAEEIDRFDPKHLSFFNVNTEADLEMARKLAGEL